jgi:hypothetical protein
MMIIPNTKTPAKRVISIICICATSFGLENSIAQGLNRKQERFPWSKVESPYEWRGTNSLERTYFKGGTDSGEAVLVGRASYPAIPHTAQKIDAARIGDLGLSGTVTLWLPGWGVAWKGEGGRSRI